MINVRLILVQIALILASINGFAQTSKVAILDFENTSGKAEYDALAISMSNMLITDLSNNIHPKKVEFFERSQLNKLLEEQKLQKSKNFDAKTAVDFGKLSGVNYVFVGSVFVMDGNCNIASQLVDVQTSKIVLSKEASGKIETWLQLKSQLAEAIAQQLDNPLTLDPSYKDQTTILATINQYGKILTTMDEGDLEKAEQMRSLFEETNPEFKYFNDLKEEIEKLRQQVEKNTKDIEILNKSGGRIIGATSIPELRYNLFWFTTPYEERQQIVKKLLSYDKETLKNNDLYFEDLYKMPASQIKLWDKIEKSLKLRIDDLDFCIEISEELIQKLYFDKESTLNTETTLYYLLGRLYAELEYHRSVNQGGRGAYQPESAQSLVYWLGNYLGRDISVEDLTPENLKSLAKEEGLDPVLDSTIEFIKMNPNMLGESLYHTVRLRINIVRLMTIMEKYKGGKLKFDVLIDGGDVYNEYDQPVQMFTWIWKEDEEYDSYSMIWSFPHSFFINESMPIKFLWDSKGHSFYDSLDNQIYNKEFILENRDYLLDPTFMLRLFGM